MLVSVTPIRTGVMGVTTYQIHVATPDSLLLCPSLESKPQWASSQVKGMGLTLIVNSRATLQPIVAKVLDHQKWVQTPLTDSIVTVTTKLYLS